MQKPLALLATLIATVLLSCVGPLTEVWVVVESNIPISFESTTPGLESVQVIVRTNTQSLWDQSYSLANRTFALPGHFVIRPSSSDESRPIELLVTGKFRGANTSVEQRAVFTFARGRRLVLRMFLAAECVGQRQLDCAAMSSTCGEGGLCIPVVRSDLAEYGGDAAAPRIDAIADATTTDGMVGLDPELQPPKLLRPLSGSVMSTARPAIRWRLIPGLIGARVELCLDRTCTIPVPNIGPTDVDGNEFIPPSDLPSGTVFFRIASRTNRTRGLTQSPVWQMRIPRTVVPIMGTQIADSAIRTDADLDGNGMADVVFDSTQGMLSRKIRVIFGTRSPMSMALEPLPTIIPTASPDLVGDLNGDGFVDFAAQVANGVQVIFGRINASENPLSTALIALPAGLTPTSGFGARLSGAGDLNGDGFGDMIIGAHRAAAGGVLQAGQAHILFGAATLPASVQPAFLQGTSLDEQLGFALSAADFFEAGAQIPSVLLSAPQGMLNPPGNLRIAKWNSMGSMLAQVGLVNLAGAANPAHFGTSMALMGDNNGDGRADLIVGAPDFQQVGIPLGTVRWQPGPLVAGGNPTRSLEVGAMGQPIGSNVAHLGDVDGDGFGDLALTRRNGNALVDTEVGIFRGNSAGLPTVVNPVFIQGNTVAGNFVGAIVEGIGDFDGDGLADFVSDESDRGTTYRLVLYKGRRFPLGAPMVLVSGSGTVHGAAAAN